MKGTVRSGSKRTYNAKSARLLKNREAQDEPIPAKVMKVRKIEHNKDEQTGHGSSNRYDGKHAEKEEHKQLLQMRRTGSQNLDESQREAVLTRDEIEASMAEFRKSVQGA